MAQGPAHLLLQPILPYSWLESAAGTWYKNICMASQVPSLTSSGRASKTVHDSLHAGLTHCVLRRCLGQIEEGRGLRPERYTKYSQWHFWLWTTDHHITIYEKLILKTGLLSKAVCYVVTCFDGKEVHSMWDAFCFLSRPSDLPII